MGQITSLLTQLGVNETFYVMFVLFGVTYFIVSALLTKPLGSLLIERDKRTLGRQEEISLIRIELADISEKLGAQRKAAQNQASAKFAELRGNAVNQQRKILTDAREEFASKVKGARDKIEKSLTDERRKLERSTSELKDDLVAKLLGTSGAKNVSLGKEV